MSCYHPIDAWRSKYPNEQGKYPLVFKWGINVQDQKLLIPCGNCIGCRITRSKEWAMRCMHEASLYEENCFITLTYNDENVPEDMSLNKKVWQDFMRNFRQKIRRDERREYNELKQKYPNIPPLEPRKIRFYMCGEYGEDQDLLEQGIQAIGRPHFHACIFNYDFLPQEPKDREKLLIRDDGKTKLYRSPLLEKLWPYGYSSVGEVNYETAAYTARYIMKKINGEMAYDHYQRLDENTGEVNLVEPEFTLMSRRPGIGGGWFEKYKNDLKKDFITVNGHKQRPAKYYDKLFEKFDEDHYKTIKEKRLESIDLMDPELTPERLHVKETIKAKKLKLLKRKMNKYEN